MPLVDRMPAVFRHVMANNGENVANIPHIQHAFQTTVSLVNTAGNVAYTPAQIMNGYLRRDCNGTARTDTFPTAAQLVAAVPGAFVGQSFELVIENISGTAVTLTVGTASGVTITGATTVAQVTNRRFAIIITVIGATPAYAVVNRGTWATAT